MQRINESRINGIEVTLKFQLSATRIFNEVDQVLPDLFDELEAIQTYIEDRACCEIDKCTVDLLVKKEEKGK